ncbi:cytochrome c maturation protein CcmE [Pantoea sp. 1.19]|uniref:cytochrome c maturation protein CcmE n=1 Tax=Pantoea sp. 1.19 TaxID=1925589 RepID=UPI000948DE00|nr:cytochrome c maturation protein CcmE [Pantoea sp. 1.19]
MNRRRQTRLLVGLGLLAGLGLATGLMMYALRANIDLFYTPGEIVYGKGVEQQVPHPGQRLRVGGVVLPGSVRRDSTTLAVHFQLYDGRGTVAVSYTGILPDLFREGQGVVAQGVLQPGNVIAAQEVLAKHDEKYTPPEISEALKPAPARAGGGT